MPTERMHLVINGQDEDFDFSATVGELLDSLRLARQRIAVELNGALVPRASYDETPLNEGDKVEIVTFVGGG